MAVTLPSIAILDVLGSLGVCGVTGCEGYHRSVKKPVLLPEIFSLVSLCRCLCLYAACSYIS